MHQCHLVPPALSPGRLKKRAFDETLSRGPVSGPKPRPKPSCFCCLTKLRIIPPSMAVKKKTARRSLDLADKAEGTMTKYYWAFARGGAWRNPKPTGGPYVCEQCRLDACGGNDTTLTHAGCHNNRAGPCGRLRRMRCAVVGGTGGQRLSKTPPRILDGTIHRWKEPLPCYRAEPTQARCVHPGRWYPAPTANDFSGAVSVSCMAT